MPDASLPCNAQEPYTVAGKNGGESMLGAAEITLEPKIAHVGCIGKAKLIPRQRIRDRCPRCVEQRNDVVVAAELGNPDRDITTKHLLCRRARLIDGEHVVI